MDDRFFKRLQTKVDKTNNFACKPKTGNKHEEAIAQLSAEVMHYKYKGRQQGPACNSQNSVVADMAAQILAL